MVRARFFSVESRQRLVNSSKKPRLTSPPGRKRVRFVLAFVIFAVPAIPQDLPPDVLLLSRVKYHIKQELQKLKNISCLETVRRERQPPKGKMRPLDTVRLEVLFDGRKEFFASPGARKFAEENPIKFVGSGTIADGAFAGYLSDIVLNESISTHYQGEENSGGRQLARYDYRLPVLWSGNTIRIPQGSGTVGLHGSYWVDPQTYDVVRLEVNADDIPPTLPIAELMTRINYAPASLKNDLVVLLPESAELRLARFNGEISRNRTEFTHCRVFGTDSTISFDAPGAAEQTPRFGVSSVDDTLRPLPEGLQITVRLRSRITGDLAVGAQIDGLVAGNVPGKGTVVIPAGSPVRGRIRRLEHYTDPFPYFVVALEFTEVELQRIRYRFYADPVDIEPIAGLEQKLWTKGDDDNRGLLGGGQLITQHKENLFLPDLPGVAVFFFKSVRLDLPQGFRTVWKTRALKP